MYRSKLFLEERRSNNKCVSVGSLWAESYMVCFVYLHVTPQMA